MLSQVQIFIIFILNGIIIGLVFDLFRILRLTFKTKDVITYIEDVLFWLITALILLYSIFKFNNGELRFYIFFGIFIGVLMYLLCFSKTFIAISVGLIHFIKKIVYYSIIKPLIFIYKLLKKIVLSPIVFVFINLKKVLLKIKNCHFIEHFKKKEKRSRIS